MYDAGLVYDLTLVLCCNDICFDDELFAEIGRIYIRDVASKEQVGG